MSFIKQKDSRNIIFLPFQPVEKLNMILTACNAAIVTLKEGLEAMAVPCKIYGIMASAVPVIAMVPENSEIARLVSEEKCGIVLSPADSVGLIDTIEMLKANPGLRKEMGRNGRKAFENKYSSRIAAEKYKSLLQEL